MRAFVHLMLFIVLVANQLAAQSQVEGIVKGSDGKPVSLASVLLLYARDSSLVKGDVTSIDGKFTLETLKGGNFIVSVSMMGFVKVYSQPFSVGGDENVNLNTINLVESTEDLGEVSVKAQMQIYEQHIDRLIVNVAGSISSAGSNALEILERSPGVIVNQQSGLIGMNGKTGVMVMINGKLSRMTSAELIQYLSGIPSNSIEKLELISSPPAKYDADGNGGLINIILKRNESEGTNGSFSLTGGMGFRPKLNGTINLNYKGSKASFYGELSEVRDYGRNPFQLKRRNVVNGDKISLQTDLLRLWYRNVLTGRFGAEWYFGTKTTIGAQFSGFINRFEITKEPNTNFLTKNGIPDTKVDIQRDESTIWKNGLANVGVRHQFNSKSEVSMDADLVYYKSDLTAGYDNNFEYFGATPGTSFERMDTEKQTDIRMFVTKADYFHQFEKVRFDAGLKGTFSRISNDVILERTVETRKYIDPDFTSAYDLKDEIIAAFANLSGSYLNNKMKLQAGFRAEHTFTHMYSKEDPELVLRKYWSVFPSFSASWQAARNSQYQVSYSRRISRPEYTQIAPVIAFYGWENFGSGNPKLRAGFTDNVQFNYILKNSYILTAGYSKQKDAIVGFQAKIDTITNRFYTNPENIDKINTWSIMASVPLTLTFWWQTQSSVQYAFQQVRTVHMDEKLQLDKGFWQLNGQQNFTISNGFNADISFNYICRIWQGAGLAVSYGMINAGVQKKFKDNKGTLKLTGTDLFRTFRAGLTFDYPETESYIYWRLKLDTRTVRLTYSKNFGNSKVKAGKRATGSEEDRNRVRF